jgi:hypothetical protein
MIYTIFNSSKFGRDSRLSAKLEPRLRLPHQAVGLQTHRLVGQAQARL